MFSSNTTQVSDGGYQISRSLRFNSADSAYLGRTPSTASNRKTWTWSGWVKRTKLGVRQGLFSCQLGAGLQFGFLDTDVFQMGTNAVYVLQSTQVFRDPSAWYHVVVSVNTTLASNRCSVYINGTQITAWGLNTFDSTIGQNVDTAINLNNDHALGQIGSSVSFLDGYMTEINLVDGQALTPSSFGQTDAQTGVWQPKAYAGSYGTNGFYLNFSDNSNTTAATLGKDYSGNGNNWIPFNFSVTAGAGNDSLVDSPTSYGVDTGVGGEVRGNYCTLNPLAIKSASAANGNLDGTVNSGETSYILGTIAVSSGKWYWEWTPTANLIYNQVGITKADGSTVGWLTANSFAYWYNGQKFTNSAGSSYGASFALNDIIGIALDMDAGTITFYKNGTSQGTAFSSLTGLYIPYFGNAGAGVSAIFTANFGQRPFAYTAPSGFKALCTQNLPTPTIGATTATQAGKYFNPVTYTGTGSSNSVTGVGFQPDWTWIKSRSNGAYHHRLVDAVRGVTKEIYSNLTNAEGTDSVGLTAFGSDGFTVGSSNEYNASGSTFVAWNWKANGSGSSNTSGSITSTVSANTTSGFSIVTYTGTGANATVGHGIGIAPSMVIVKQRNTTRSWIVYNSSIGATKYLVLDTTDAAGTYSFFWNNTAPTSSVFSIGTDGAVNTSAGTYVAYCFAEVSGFSKFGFYTGNGSADGPFVYTGFRPAFLIAKDSTNAATNWYMWDSVRGTYNANYPLLFPNLSNAEDTTSIPVDFLSNGFKPRISGNGFNTTNAVMIYMAFASNPFKYSLAR